MTEHKQETMTLDDLYACGELSIKDIKKVRERFDILCRHCKSGDIAIITEEDNDGCCETCSSPYSRFTIKCKGCGQAISIRN